MFTKLLGLLGLLGGVAAFFGLWMLAIKNRSKTIEPTISTRSEPVLSERPSRATAYSLAPMVTIPQAQERRVVRDSSNAIEPQAEELRANGSKIVEPDPLARTHLEIAGQLFDRGDFEGAVDMCNLVIENVNASPAQSESARQLAEKSA